MDIVTESIKILVVCPQLAAGMGCWGGAGSNIPSLLNNRAAVTRNGTEMLIVNRMVDWVASGGDWAARAKFDDVRNHDDRGPQRATMRLSRRTSATPAGMQPIKPYRAWCWNPSLVLSDHPELYPGVNLDLLTAGAGDGCIGCPDQTA
eukprot:SAG11_NODE_4783_length_1767_cov_1.642686_2_plen_148_part_00